MTTTSYRNGVLFAALSALLWATGNLLPGVSSWDAWSLLLVRGGIGILAAGAYLRIDRERLFSLDPWEWAGGFCLAALSTSVYLSIKLGSASVATVLMYTGPSFSALFEHFTRRRLPARVWSALLVSLGGIACVRLDEVHAVSALPFTLGVAAGVAYALWGECHQRQWDVESSRGVLYGYFLSICAAFLPAWVRLHELDTSPGELAKALCTGLAHIAAYLTLVAAFARIPAFIALVVTSAEVPLVAVGAAIFAGERPGALTLLGGALIFAANVQVTMWGRKGT